MIYFIDGIGIFSKLLQNIVLLFALIFIYAATNLSPGPTKIKQKILLGFVIGGFAILLMMNPWEIEAGLIFDTRSALFAVSGLFFGPLSTLIGVLVAVVYRIFLGGGGVYAGVATIISTATLGLLWFRIRRVLPKMYIAIEYYVLGLIAHIVTLLCFLLIPWPLAFEVIRSTILLYLILFPIVTMLLALSLNNQKQRLISTELINKQKLLLQSSLDSTKTMEIFVIDANYQYLAFNQFHASNMKLYNHIEIQKGMNYIDCINSDKMKKRIKSSIDTALSGETIKKVIEVEVNKGQYLEEIYTPIIDEKGLITGATIFSEDVTENYLHELSILHLSYRDHLTNLYNRRYYTEELARLDHDKYLPLSIVIADINGLKIMNDAFGHQMGDQLLIKVANIFVETFKKESRVTRIGGDEFIILMPNTTTENAHSQIEMLRNRLEEEKIMDMAISVSFGIATKNEDEPIEEIIKAAEDDMYTHKLFEINSHRNETIKTIINTLHEKNPREELHSERVSSICNLIGKALNMSIDDLKLLTLISQLHDIGKIGIDDSILNKPGKLTDKEWESIKKHPEIGYRILSTAPEYSEIAQDILSHHERYDGKGYPRGLKADDIPLRARIISIADAYDAMISERPYRKALTHNQAIEEIKINAGSQFDPAIAKIFIELFNESEGL
ncbi:MAG: diguanylate cyclase [Acholeplasmataceae bacterium]|nr:diguanylate cyclase [Acholeplasmataceae bacterium]